MSGRIVIRAGKFWRVLADGRLAPVLAPQPGGPTSFATTAVNQRRIAADRAAAAREEVA